MSKPSSRVSCPEREQDFALDLQDPGETQGQPGRDWSGVSSPVPGEGEEREEWQDSRHQ